MLTNIHPGSWALGLCALLIGRSALASSDSASFDLALRGGFVSRADGQNEISAVLSLNIPLARAVRPRLLPLDLQHLAQAAPPKADARPSTEPSKTEAPRRAIVALVTPGLAHATVRAALRTAGRARSEARLDGLASRARASAALPELRLRAARTTDESLRLTPTTAEPYRYTQAGGVSIALEAQATWKLDRAVFADEELQVEHLRRLRVRQEARLVEDVLRALFAWQRALSGAFVPEAAPEDQELAGLRVIEAEVRLDVLTGGWFSARVAALKKNGLSRARRPE